MNDKNQRDGLQGIIDSALESMGAMGKDGPIPEKINLAELGRRTGLTRSKCRTLQKKGFVVGPHGRCGSHAKATVLTGYADVIDKLLRVGVTNSSVIYERLCERGYTHGLTVVKDYIAAHKDLAPSKRALAAQAPNRGRRYSTEPGECFQMDWGFVNILNTLGEMARIACFSMICHHCGVAFIEFFPNARQENLFIGMVHGFMIMGVPKYVLTDNMKSVTTGRDVEGRPLFQPDYAAFMDAVGFRTRLCKPYHPFTKGKVERLILYVKRHFCQGRPFTDITDLNQQALEWCAERARLPKRWSDFIPAEEHAAACIPKAGELVRDDAVAAYLCPRRRVSFDGFVCYEGRRFGVPYWHAERVVRVNREGRSLHIYSEDLTRELTVHPITWARADTWCDDQFAQTSPAELPTAPVTTAMPAIKMPAQESPLARFDFESRVRP